jgi:hypothetical protein
MNGRKLMFSANLFFEECSYAYLSLPNYLLLGSVEWIFSALLGFHLF